MVMERMGAQLKSGSVLQLNTRCIQLSPSQSYLHRTEKE